MFGTQSVCLFFIISKNGNLRNGIKIMEAANQSTKTAKETDNAEKLSRFVAAIAQLQKQKDRKNGSNYANSIND